MNKIATIFVLALVVGLVPAMADITFNDLATPNPASGGAAAWGVIPTTYAGFTWSGWEVINGQSFNTVYSSIFSGPFPNNAGYNGGAGNLTVTTSGDPFNFTGADFSFWPNVGSAAATSVTVAGFLNGNPVGSTVVSLSVGGFHFVPFALNGVNELTFTSSTAGQYWLTDNLQISSVPDDGTTLALLGLAIAGLAGLRRKLSL
jgi:hypothetical protein